MKESDAVRSNVTLYLRVQENTKGIARKIIDSTFPCENSHISTVKFGSLPKPGRLVTAYDTIEWDGGIPTSLSAISGDIWVLK